MSQPLYLLPQLRQSQPMLLSQPLLSQLHLGQLWYQEQQQKLHLHQWQT